jgi:Skp family chaperone for outer membrane proteins
MRIALTLSLAIAGLTACASHQQAAAPRTAPADAPAPQHQASAPAAPARNPESDREIARLRAQVQDRNAQITDLQRRLSEAMNEAVRAMARLRTLATRAEAASAMAEAEVTVQQVKQRSPHADLQETDRLMRTASVEFEAENYGGAVYLATQAKRSATSAESH